MRENPQIAVYIMASARNGTLYTSVTSDIFQRVIDHKTARYGGFSARHGCKMLVWFEQHGEMLRAIAQEKAMKPWRRAWKLSLIERMNPEWRICRTTGSIRACLTWRYGRVSGRSS